MRQQAADCRFDRSKQKEAGRSRAVLGPVVGGAIIRSLASASIFRAMGDESDTPSARVWQVFALVDLQSSWLAEANRRGIGIFVGSFGNREDLSLHVSLLAELCDGRRIAARTGDFGMSGPRRGIWHRWHGPPLPADPEEANRLMLTEHHVDRHDIEDGINQMLGRDPDLHHPPRLAWDGLIATLAEAGVHVTERDLIETPFTVELTSGVQAELDPS